MRHFSFLVVLLLLSVAGYSQITASSYGFTASSGVYSSIATSGTVPTVSSYPYTFSADDAASDVIPIGFTFTYCGVDYTSLTACTNGWLSLSGYSSSDNYNALSELPYVGNGVGLLMPMWDDLNGSSMGTAFYTTTGVPGSRKFIFEWKGFERYGYTGGGSQDFQVILYETSNQIDFVYTNGSMPSGCNYSVGITNSSTDYQTLPNSSASPAPSSTVFTNTINASPADAQIYSWAPPAPCSGGLVAGTATSNVITACATDNITLNVTGGTVATGFSYQWQSSEDAVVWTNIAGATTIPYNATESTDMYYRVIVTCPSSGSYDSSSSVLVNFSTACYCTPSYTSSPATTTTYGLDQVLLTGYSGSSLADAGPSVIPINGYEDRTSISVDLQQGIVYSGTLTYVSSFYPNYQSQIWIDANDDGNFDVTEEVTPVITSGYGSYALSDGYSLTVPITIPTGTHRMRVRYAEIGYTSSNSADMDPCNSYDGTNTYYNGTTRDYTVNIVPAPTCTGTPTAGTATATTTLACPSTSFVLNAIGTSIASDLTYQWESSATGALGSWAPIAGATSLMYTATVTAPAYYHLVITCPSSTLFDTSTSVFVNYLGFCYCTPTYTYSPASSTYDGMDNFSVTGYSGSSISDAGPASIPAAGYEDRTSISVDFQQGNAYSGTISYLSTYNSYESQVWIDFNNDGVFDNTEEVSPIIYSAPYASSDAFTLNIPISAAVGAHRMRVRYSVLYYGSSSSTDMDPCYSSDGSSNTYLYGTVRDYTANIIAAPTCTGTPTGGTATASVTLGCPSTAFTLNATGITVASGLTYQWQSSATGTSGTFTDIPGATTVIYSYTESAPTYYQLVVTCPASGLSGPSTSVFVNYLGFCYCTPSYSSSPAGSYGYGLDLVTINGYSGSTLSDAGTTPVPASGYEDRTTISVDFQQGGSYTGTLNYSTGSSSYHDQIWIDFNDDGVFDISEEVTPVISSGCSYVYSDAFTLNIPLTANVGLHRMRVRNIMPYSCSATPDIDPCAPSDATYSYTYGATRDYMANIIALPPCSGAPVAGDAAITPTSGGASVVFTLSLPGAVSATGVTYQWQSSASATGPWTNIAGATNNTYTFTSIFADTYFQCVLTCSLSGGTTSIATPVLATYVPTPPCFPSGSSWGWSYGVSYYGLDQFSVTGFAGTSIADVGLTTTVDPSTGYLDHTALPAISMEQGGVYPASGTWINAYDHQAMQVWIDFNDNGVFEAVEEVSPVSGFDPSSTPNPGTFNISVPVGATAGLHNMRMRAIYEDYPYGSSVPAHLDPCNINYLGVAPNYYSGDAVDYKVNIIIPCPFTASATTGSAVCPNSPVSLTATTTAPTYSWSGPGGFTTTSLVVTAPGIPTTGVYTFTATNGTCTLTLTAVQNLLPAALPPVVTPAPVSICNGSSQTLTATVPGTTGTIFSEDFNSGLGAWTVDNTGMTSASPLGPWQTQPDGYSYGGTYHSPDHSQFVVTVADAGGSGSHTSTKLISPTFSLAGMASASLSFQHAYNYYSGDIGVTVDISTDGGTTWNTLNDYYTGGSSVGSHTSFQTDTYPLSSYLGSANTMIRFYYNSIWGFEWAIDNVIITGTPTVGDAPTWTPVTDLYTDPAFTTPYTGSAAYSVYLHPTTTITTTTTNYIANVSLGTCLSSDTSAVTVIAVAPITGVLPICAGNNITLSDTTIGGVWSSSNVTVATVNPTTGVVHGLTSGADTIYYTVSGCSSYTVVNVSTFVTNNTGNTIICSGGLTTVLSNPTPSGTWVSGNTSVATVSATGTVTSVGAGSAIITYTLPTGCSDTSLITVVAPPAAISGVSSVCYSGGTTTLTDPTPGGVWSTSAGSIATITAGGVVTGLSSGSATITYTTLPGCYATLPLTLNANPANITGTMSVCASGGATTLSDVTPSGTWTSSAPTTATVSSTGVVTGVIAGSVIITYTATNGCKDTALVTVHALPSVITGTMTICNLASTTLADASAPGTWTTSTPLIATVNASGMVTGITSGTAVIIFTQTSTGCTRSASVTINALPAAITGSATVCNLSTTTLSTTSTGGTWSSSAPTVASIESSTGVVHGISVGSATITYTNASGCYVTKPITVNPSFVPTVSLAVAPGTTVCEGAVVSYVPTVVNGGASPTYSWTVNGTPVSTLSTYTYTPANGDLVSVSIVSNLSCAVPTTASTFVTMTVNPIVVPSITIGSNYGDTACFGAMTTIYSHPVDGGTTPAFQWYVNGTPVSTASNYTYIPTLGDVVSVTMTSTAACLSGSTSITASDTITMDVIPNLVPDVTVTSSTGAVACLGNIVVFNTTEVNGGSAPSYLWTVNGINVATGPTYYYVPANGDVVVVTMNSNYPCVIPAYDTAGMTMTVVASATPACTITAYPGSSVPAGMNDSFVVAVTSGGGAAPTYQWYLNGVVISGATSVSYVTSTLATGDIVTCHVTNTDPCGGVTVSNGINITIGGVGISSTMQGEGSISLLPNPNSGSFILKGTIGVNDNEEMTIEVTDMMGQVVFTGRGAAKNGVFNEQIQLSGRLANGMYVLNVRSSYINKTFHFVLEQQ